MRNVRPFCGMESWRCWSDAGSASCSLNRLLTVPASSKDRRIGWIIVTVASTEKSIRRATRSKSEAVNKPAVRPASANTTAESSKKCPTRRLCFPWWEAEPSTRDFYYRLNMIVEDAVTRAATHSSGRHVGDHADTPELSSDFRDEWR
jgi:hypothetical protein